MSGHARVTGQILLAEGFKHILALESHNARMSGHTRMSGQVFLVEGLKHILALQSHNARIAAKSFLKKG